MIKKRSHNVRKITWDTLPERIKKVREKILSAGNTIGGVYFTKRTNDELRGMNYRLHVRNPKYVRVPSSNKEERLKRWKKDRDNLQLTVMDINSPITDNTGKIIGRGQYRTIPLENVNRITVHGKTYIIDDKRRREKSNI